jgi:uncharacterized DUF497 family protein
MYKQLMKIEFDSSKSRRNIAHRGLGFDRVAEFDFDTALIVEDDRRDYGEVRYRAIGPLGAEVVVVVFTMRGKTVRVISLRHASKKERQDYEST